MNEIVDLLRNVTHLGRLARHEVVEVVARLEAEGYAIVKKVAPEIEPVAEAVKPEAPIAVDSLPPVPVPAQ